MVIKTTAWRLLLAACASAMTVAAACRTPRENAATTDAGLRGQIMLAVNTDLVWGKDLDAISVTVSHHSEEQLVVSLAPSTTKLPATVSVAAPASDADPVSIRVVGSLGGKERIRRDIVTSVPENRNALLWAPLQWLCDAAAGAPTCSESQTCVLGACVASTVSSAELPDYAAAEFSDGACFDTAKCFARSTAVQVVDPATCTIPASSTSNVNVALVTKADGVCDGSGCLVPLERGPYGWNESKASAQAGLVLPPAACALALNGRITLAQSTACPPRSPSAPTCAGGPSPTGPQLLGTIPAQPMGEIAVDAQYVYLSLGDGLWRMPKTGGDRTRLLPDPLMPMWLDGSQLFLVGGTSGAYSLQRFDLQSGSSTPLFTFDSKFGSPLCITKDRVFVLGNSGSAFGVWHAPRAGGAAGFDAVANAMVDGIGCDGQTVFWDALFASPDGGGVPATEMNGDLYIQDTTCQTDLQVFSWDASLQQLAHSDVSWIQIGGVCQWQLGHYPARGIVADATDVYILANKNRGPSPPPTAVLRVPRGAGAYSVLLTLAPDGRRYQPLSLTKRGSTLYGVVGEVLAGTSGNYDAYSTKQRIFATSTTTPLQLTIADDVELLGGCGLVADPSGTATGAGYPPVKRNAARSCIAVDEEYVYYVTQASGADTASIWRVRHP